MSRYFLSSMKVHHTSPLVAAGEFYPCSPLEQSHPLATACGQLYLAATRSNLENTATLIGLDSRTDVDICVMLQICILQHS